MGHLAIFTMISKLSKFDYKCGLRKNQLDFIAIFKKESTSHYGGVPFLLKVKWDTSII